MIIMLTLAIAVYGLGPNWDGEIMKEWLTKLKNMVK